MRSLIIGTLHLIQFYDDHAKEIWISGTVARMEHIRKA
jgi:hypothetical protein